MAVTLRLMRLGKRHKPFYRIIATDKRKKRNGRYIESLGTYDPLTNPSEIDIDKKKFEYWTQKGAVVSEGLRKLIKNSNKS